MTKFLSLGGQFSFKASQPWTKVNLPSLAPVRYCGYSVIQMITTNDIPSSWVTGSREQSLLQEQCDSSRRLESLHPEDPGSCSLVVRVMKRVVGLNASTDSWSLLPKDSVLRQGFEP